MSKGLSFFLYAEKYADLIKKLLQDEDDNHAEVKAFRELDHQLIAHFSPYALYLRELFWLASVMYVDQFGYCQFCRRIILLIYWM